MTRAERLHSVLADGRAHSRQDIFDRVGYMLTNNAASELRAQGVEVEHSVADGLHVYRLVALDDAVPSNPVAVEAWDSTMTSAEAHQAHQRDWDGVTASSSAAYPPPPGVALTLFEDAA